MKILASITAALVLTTAGAATAQQARVAWGDLDLSTAAGARAFDARVETAARTLCRTARRPGSFIPDQSHCRAAFQAEAVRQLPGAARVDYASSRRSIDL
jgi:UrcA family protein